MSDSENVFLAATMVGVGEDTPNINQIGQTPKKELPDFLKTTDGLRHHMVDYVKRFWADPDNDRDTSFTPMVLAVCENGDVVPMMVALDFTEEEKEKFAIQCQMLFKLWGVERYAFVSEAWVAEYPKDTDMKKGPRVMPAQMESRKEIVMILVAGRDDNDQQFVAYEMVRDWNTGKVTELVEYEMIAGMTTQGRFARLLKDPPVHPAHKKETIDQIAMIKFLCHPPEDELRPRYEENGQDFDAMQRDGKELWNRLEVAFNKMSETPVYSLTDEIVGEVNQAMFNAREFAGRIVADIQERRTARERAH